MTTDRQEEREAWLLKAAVQLGELMERRHLLEFRRHRAKVYKEIEWTEADQSAWQALSEPYNEAKGFLLRAYRALHRRPSPAPAETKEPTAATPVCSCNAPFLNDACQLHGALFAAPQPPAAAPRFFIDHAVIHDVAWACLAVGLVLVFAIIYWAVS